VTIFVCKHTNVRLVSSSDDHVSHQVDHVGLQRFN
jgi:hypothetical protein